MIYIWLQAYLTHHSWKIQKVEKRIVTIRIVLGVLAFLAAITGCIFDLAHNIDSGPLSYPDRTKYGNAFGWLLAVLLCIFVLTFTVEFRLIKKIGINLTTVRPASPRRVDDAEEPLIGK